MTLRSTLATWAQGTLIKLIFGQKEKLLAWFLARLEKEYQNNRSEIAHAILAYLPKDMKRTASPEEIQALVDLLKNFLEEAVALIAMMRQETPTGMLPPGQRPPLI